MLTLKSKKGVWVDYPHAQGVRLQIRPFSFGESLTHLNQAKEKKVVEGLPIDPKVPEKKATEIVDDYDNAVFLWESFNATLVAWEGIELEIEEGEVAPGPLEVKKAMFDNDKLRNFVFEHARKLAGLESIEQEKERKNL